MFGHDRICDSRSPGAVAAVLCCLAIGALAARASTQTAAGPHVAQFSSVAIAPDGRRAAWIGAASAGGDAQSVMLAATSGAGAPARVPLAVENGESPTEVVWSADSRELGVLAADGGTPAIYVVNVASRIARRVARVSGSVHDIRFSPDGSRIALLYSSPSEEANGPTQATPRDTGVMDTHIDRQHLALVDVGTGAQRIVSPADLYVYEFDWSPNGRELVVSAATGSGNNNWWVARVDAIDAASGAVRQIARPAVQIAEPRWSPDGSQIAFIGGVMSDQGSTGGDLYTVPAAGGTPRDLTPNASVSVAAFRWQGPHAMLATMWSHGGSEIAAVNAATGAITSLWHGDETITTRSGRGLPDVSAADTGRDVALVRESLATPPEVWAGAVGHWTQLTHANAAIAPSWGKAVSVHWRSDRFNVQGFLIYPRDFRSGTRYPMIVLVHGGPAAAVASTFLSDQSQQAALSRAGYFVFMPNPRGSFGQGEAFTRANVKDFGHGDLRDIMAGVDSVIARYPVDPRRLGLTGWSYGGYMTMWAVTQTQRFRAAVAGAGISDWLSYTGENGISEWMVPYFGTTVYENPAVYARSSPMNYIAHARTPMLIVVGERDAECPAPQSFEYWRGLQHEGVKTQLVVYPDEGHHFADPAHQADVLRRSIAWFDSYLKPRPPG